MRYGRYGWSHLMLSWGLGLTFLWIGIDILRFPTNWIGFLPPSLPFNFSRDLALQLNGILDVILGGLLFIRWFPRLSALVAALHLAGILATQGIDAILIRDVGLLGASMSLLLWPQHGQRRGGWRKMFSRKSSSYASEEE